MTPREMLEALEAWKEQVAQTFQGFDHTHGEKSNPLTVSINPEDQMNFIIQGKNEDGEDISLTAFITPEMGLTLGLMALQWHSYVERLENHCPCHRRDNVTCQRHSGFDRWLQMISDEKA